APAAVLRGHRRAEEAFLAEAAPGGAVGRPAAVPLGDLGLDLALGEAPELGAEHRVLVGEDLAAHRFTPASAAGSSGRSSAGRASSRASRRARGCGPDRARRPRAPRSRRRGATW